MINIGIESRSIKNLRVFHMAGHKTLGRYTGLPVITPASIDKQVPLR